MVCRNKDNGLNDTAGLRRKVCQKGMEAREYVEGLLPDTENYYPCSSISYNALGQILRPGKLLHFHATV